MKELIEKQAVIDALLAKMDTIDDKPDVVLGMAVAAGMIKDMPSVTPAEKVGHWFIDERSESNREIICSNCEQPIFKYHKMDFDYRPNFCPNCGTKMREVKE